MKLKLVTEINNLLLKVSKYVHGDRNYLNDYVN